MENTSFGRFSTDPHHQDHPAAVGGILDPSDWLSYLPDLNLLDYSTWRVLQRKVQVTPLDNLATLHPFITVE
jgi:hypothetical protein